MARSFADLLFNMACVLATNASVPSIHPASVKDWNTQEAGQCITDLSLHSRPLQIRYVVSLKSSQF